MLIGYFRVYLLNALVVTFLVRNPIKLAFSAHPLNRIQVLCSYIYLLSLVNFKKYTSAQAFNILLLLPNLIKWKLILFLLNLLLLLVNQRYLPSPKIPLNLIAAPLNAILLKMRYPTKISTKALIGLYFLALIYPQSQNETDNCIFRSIAIKSTKQKRKRSIQYASSTTRSTILNTVLITARVMH